MKHELKILPAYFEAVLSGEKTFEIRNNSDRGFQKGDIVTLIECTNGSMITATGRQVTRQISYVTNYGQTDGMVVFGMKVSDDQLADLRLSLDAALLEIDNLNQDIEKLRSHGQIVPEGWRLVADSTIHRAVTSLIDRVNPNLSCNETAVEQLRFMNEITAATKPEGGAA